MDGSTYYQQSRRCSTPGYRCQSGQLHGPYWWRRNGSGRVKYLGRDLPPELAEVRARRDRLKPAMANRERELLTQAAKLQRQAQALHRLYYDKAMLPGDEKIIEELGFGEALVSAGGAAATQGERSGQ